MKALVIDRASPVYARLCRLLDESGQAGSAELPELLACRKPGELLLVRAQPPVAARTRLCVRVRDGLRQIPVDAVRYFLAEHKYVWVRTAQGRWLIADSLRALEREFAGRFIRVHRNALVAVPCLEGLEVRGGGRRAVRLAGIDETLSVSRRRLAVVRRLLRATPLQADPAKTPPAGLPQRPTGSQPA
jgi:DNA-binding LytR/AlgR family response regulator